MSDLSAVIRKLGPHQWRVELLRPWTASITLLNQKLSLVGDQRGYWVVELYLEFKSWEDALAKAVEWQIAGKVNDIVYDDRDKEAG